MPEPHTPTGIPPDLLDFFQEHLESSVQKDLTQVLKTLPPTDRPLVFELISELIEASPRSAGACLMGLKALYEQAGFESLIPWLDLGVCLSERSSIITLKYFKTATGFIPNIRPEIRTRIFQMALELSEGPYSVVNDFIRAASTLPASIQETEIDQWMRIGQDLSHEDLVMAIEFYQVSPQVLELISTRDIPEWVQLGRNLIESTGLEKPDYLKVIEFFRLSYDTLSEFSSPALRILFIRLGKMISGNSPTTGLAFLREAPDLLKKLDSDKIRGLFLDQSIRIAGIEPPMAFDFLKGGPRMFSVLEGNTTDLVAWVDTGLTLFSSKPERARAYFQGQSKTVEETTEKLIGGVSLQTVGRVLQLFAEGLTGTRILLKPSTELSALTGDESGDFSTTDGRTIYLPARIRSFPDDQDNFRVYKLSVMHEAAHLEFGTYLPGLEAIGEVAADLRRKSPSLEADQTNITTLPELFSLFPDPGWARFLWSILEDARIDSRIRAEYPGIKKDMDWLISVELQNRSKLETLPPRTALREALVQLSATDTTEVSLELAETVSGAHRFMQEVKDLSATSASSLKTLLTLYRFLETELKRFPETEGEADPLGVEEKSILPEPGEKGEGRGGYKNISFSYRGKMNPEWVKGQQPGTGKKIDPSQLNLSPEKSRPQENSPVFSGSDREENNTPGENRPEQIDQTGLTQDGNTESDFNNIFLYDEWDEAVGEFRPKWCRLREESLPAESSTMVDETLSSYRSTLRLLRRHFQSLKPEALRKIRRQDSGEDIDLDAVVEQRTDIRTGQMPSDHIYTKTEKRDRSVAVAFLVDMSGSTNRIIPSTGRRVIDIEKEALILMAEALQAVGDPFAIYGFSGGSRKNVEFFIVKDFSSPFNKDVQRRIGAMRALNQNRDGTAIRHAVTKLSLQEARTRLLILLSDGRPLDTDYSGQYSLQDTKAALRDARRKGIHPYCITVDQEASQYVSEMYGDVRHTIIDQTATLPEKLPRIYRKLTT